MFTFGNHGVDVQLYDMRNTADIYWTPKTANSYVRVSLDGLSEERVAQLREAGHVFRNPRGEEFLIVSVNGIGEVRWDVRDYSPNRDMSFLSADDKLAVVYFTVPAIPRPVR